MEKPRVSFSLLYRYQWDADGLARFRDEWAMRHFLHPKLLRKAREVRAQLEDIMKFQKMELISAGTDFDVLRSVSVRWIPVTINVVIGKRSLPVISIKQQKQKALVNLSTFGQDFRPTFIPPVRYMDLDVCDRS